jgi:hypothetical protein
MKTRKNAGSKGRRNRTEIGQAAMEQDFLLFSMLRRRYRAGQLNQEKGLGRGMGRTIGFCNQRSR